MCMSSEMAFFWFFIFLLCFVTFVREVLSMNSKQRVLQVYSVPGKWYTLKYVFVVVLLAVRKFLAKYSQKRVLSPGYGIQSCSNLEEMDKRIPLSSDPKAFDAVYFNGANRIGWNIIIGCALRPKNVDGFLILKVPGVGLLLSPRLPDTVLFKKEEDLSCFSTDGLILTPLKPMQLWHLQYNGKMRLSHKPHKKVKVEIDATWESNLPIFNYDTNVLTKNIAKAMSRESWSSQYFKLLKNFHQTHYEQFGELSGKVIIDGMDFKLNMSTMRDHSFGLRREWRAFHRYMLLMFTLADGTCGTVGIVCIPNLFSRMEIGYVYGKDKRLEAVYDVDFDLYNHGETGLPPTDFGLTFFAGGRFYEMKVHVEETTELFLGLTWEARIVEGLCRFSINRVDGWGCVEWMYAHSDGRPFKQTSKHPLAAE